MKLSRFYQNTSFKVGSEYILTAENHRHVVQVLRHKVADMIILFNGEGGEYRATLTEATKKRTRVIIDSYSPVNRESSLNMTLALALIKSERMDFALQKAVELGVTRLQPITTQRTVIKIKANRLEKKMQHWEGVVIAACEQSGRTCIPVLNMPISLEKYLSDQGSHPGLVMLPDAPAGINDLRELDATQQINLLVGPEGGFTEAEEQLMRQSGITPVSFGPRILRAETAAIAGLTACQQKWGDLA